MHFERKQNLKRLAESFWDLSADTGKGDKEYLISGWLASWTTTRNVVVLAVKNWQFSCYYLTFFGVQISMTLLVGWPFLSFFGKMLYGIPIHCWIDCNIFESNVFSIILVIVFSFFWDIFVFFFKCWKIILFSIVVETCVELLCETYLYEICMICE